MSNSEAVSAFWSTVVQTRLAPFEGDTSLNATETTLSALKDELISARSAVCAIATRHNALVPVARLPPEILDRIFAFVAHQTLSVKNSNREDGRWINITHVCRSWRELAMSSHTLWTSISFAFGVSGMTTFLRRSNLAPISFLNETIPVRADHATLVLQTLARTKKLEFYHMGDDARAMLYQSLITPAPLLEEVSFHAGAGEDLIVLPPNIFGSHTPRLRYVSFTNVKELPFTSPTWRNVVSLKLEIKQISNTPLGRQILCPFLHDILALLRSTQCLETLWLTGFVPLADNLDMPIKNPKVNLPHLRELSLQDILARSVYFMRHLLVPPTAHLRLISTMPSETRHVRLLFEVLREHIARGKGLPVPSPYKAPLSVLSLHTHANDASLVMRALRNAEEQLDTIGLFPNHACGIYIRFSLPGTTDPSSMVPALLREAFRTPFLTRLKGVVLDVGCIWLPSSQWMSLLGEATDLLVFRCTGRPGLSLCSALARSTAAGHPALSETLGSQGTVLLPNLSRLILDDISTASVPTVRERESLSPMIQTLLKVRQIHGAPLDSLRLNGCAIAGEDIKTFRALCPLVETDGDEDVP